MYTNASKDVSDIYRGGPTAEPAKEAVAVAFNYSCVHFRALFYLSIERGPPWAWVSISISALVLDTMGPVAWAYFFTSSIYLSFSPLISFTSFNFCSPGEVYNTRIHTLTYAHIKNQKEVPRALRLPAAANSWENRARAKPGRPAAAVEAGAACC